MDTRPILVIARVVALAFATVIGMTSALAENSSMDRSMILRVAEQ